MYSLCENVSEGEMGRWLRAHRSRCRVMPRVILQEVRFARGHRGQPPTTGSLPSQSRLFPRELGGVGVLRKRWFKLSPRAWAPCSDPTRAPPARTVCPSVCLYLDWSLLGRTALSSGVTLGSGVVLSGGILDALWQFEWDLTGTDAGWDSSVLRLRSMHKISTSKKEKVRFPQEIS